VRPYICADGYFCDRLNKEEREADDEKY